MANKTTFRTPYGEREHHYTTSGSMYQNEYGYEIDKFGRKVLVKTGETNLYAKIQESLEETKIENILKRAAIGDMSVFRPEGIYADTTEMPKTFLEARQQIQNLENLWAKLPADVKHKYNNSVEDFINSAGKEDWLRDMGLLKEKTPEAVPETAPAKVEEVTSNE